MLISQKEIIITNVTHQKQHTRVLVIHLAHILITRSPNYVDHHEHKPTFTAQEKQRVIRL